MSKAKRTRRRWQATALACLLPQARELCERSMILDRRHGRSVIHGTLRQAHRPSSSSSSKQKLWRAGQRRQARRGSRHRLPPKHLQRCEEASHRKTRKQRSHTPSPDRRREALPLAPLPSFAFRQRSLIPPPQQNPDAIIDLLGARPCAPPDRRDRDIDRQ